MHPLGLQQHDWKVSTMTFDELMKKTLEVFPNALLMQDEHGSILIEPGFKETSFHSEPLIEYNPEG